MQSLIQLLSAQVGNAFSACGYDAALGQVRLSDRPDLCEFQCNGAFAAAKHLGKPPARAASEIAAQLQSNPIFEHVDVAGAGFLNLHLSAGFLLSYTAEMLADPQLGIPQAATPEHIFIDYGGPNIAKPLHIGHLRSAIIGESLKRLAVATGRKVTSDVHLGDWGLQMGLVIAQLEEDHPAWACFSPAFSVETADIHLTAKTLSTVYPAASKRSKEDPTFLERAQAATAALQQGNPGYTALWQHIVAVSVADIQSTYKLLGVDFDLWLGEHDAQPYVQALLHLLEEKELLRESCGAKVVDISKPDDKKPVPPVLVKKSDGSDLYATTDLAALLQRQQWRPDHIWYVVDHRQSLHFIQVFRCARLAGFVPPEMTLEHLGFGTMNGRDGKPYKTRDGGVPALSEFYEMVYQSSLKRVRTSTHSSPADHPEIARKLAVAAIKFGDLINHRSKDYCFDTEKFLATEGKTGSFLLYTLARIHSILKKADASQVPFSPRHLYSDTERSLLLRLACSGEVFSIAFDQRAPNLICENAYAVASLFSKFYHDSHILTEPDAEKRNAWLALCSAVKTVLEKHFYVLGIEILELL